VFTQYYEEIPGIDPQIVQHEIQTYENVKSIRLKLRPMNPRKEIEIKVEILKAS